MHPGLWLLKTRMLYLHVCVCVYEFFFLGGGGGGGGVDYSPVYLSLVS